MNEHSREKLHPWHCERGSETNVERKRREGDDGHGPSALRESLCTGLLRRAEGRGGAAAQGHHMAASWPSTILNCCVLLARSLTRSTMSLEAAGDG